MNAGATASEWAVNNGILGDAAAGRVIRVLRVIINNGTNAATLKCSAVSVWNGDAVAEEDNLGKGGDTGNFALAAGGAILTIQDSGLSGTAVGIVAVSPVYNVCGTSVTVLPGIAGGLVLHLYVSLTGAEPDLTTLVDTGQIQFLVTYITSA